MSVRAFKPRTIEPPQFVAEDIEELEGKEGEYISSEQCDGCGNPCYQIRVRMIQPGVRQFEAVCAVDPATIGEEFTHTDPCGAAYPVTIWDDDLVCF